MLAGEQGPATAMCMRLIVGVARANGAERLVPIESAHADGCLYHGLAGLEFTERLVSLGARVRVRTTLNVGSLDLLHPGLVRADAELAENGRRLMDAHVALGCEPIWSCAPYQSGHRPKEGSHVAWAESNAIAFVNSVLGVRTDRYGDFIDIAAGIAGRVPYSGLHLEENRTAALVLDFSAVPEALLEEDAAWPTIGALLGELAGSRVAALTGLPGDLNDGGVTEDRLKALGATAASAGGVALFHVVGVTPEAPTLDSVLDAGATTVPVTTHDLRRARDRLSTAATESLDAVSLGTPHFSLSEFAALARGLRDGESFSSSVDVFVSTSRAVLAEAEARGYADAVREAGGRILTDTCTYVTPVLRGGVRTVMTNSGKWAWIVDVHHPQRGSTVAGRVLAMPTGRGSSSSTAVLAELIRSGHAPAALLLAECDAILVIGALVAAEVYDTALPIVQLAHDDLARLESAPKPPSVPTPPPLRRP